MEEMFQRMFELCKTSHFMIINFTFLLHYNFYTFLYYVLYYYTSEDCAEGIQVVKYIKLIDCCFTNMYGLEVRVNMDTQIFWLDFCEKPLTAVFSRCISIQGWGLLLR